MNLKKKVIKNNFKNISLNKLFTVIVIFQPNKKKIENVLQKHLEVFSNVIVVCNSSIDFNLGIFPCIVFFSYSYEIR